MRCAREATSTNMGLPPAVRQQHYRVAHPDRVRAAKRLVPSYRAGCRRRNKRYNDLNKVIVLTHYGPQGELRCAWNGCDVTDIDMLSLDHINNDGNVARRQSKQNAGVNFYRRLKVARFPDGYQTLCHNHQWKKELMRRRGE